MIFNRVTNPWTNVSYTNIYYRVGGTLGANCAALADAHASIDSGNLQPQLNNIDFGGIGGVTQTRATNGSIAANAHLYHTSAGSIGAGHSAAIFFAVYAVAAAYAPLANDPYSRRVTYLGHQDLRVKYDDPAPQNTDAFNPMRQTGLNITNFPLLPAGSPVTTATGVQNINLKLVVVLAGLGYHNGGARGHPQYTVPIRDGNYITANTVRL